MLLVINIVVIFSFGSTLPLPEVQQTEQRRDVVGLGEEGGYIEGDIIPFPTPSTRTLRGANDIISDYTEGTLWPNNTVYFMHDSNLSDYHLDIFNDAMRMISAKTCIEFVPADNETEAYLNLTTRHNECCSYVGMVGTVQDVSLGPGCSQVGNAIHEIGHALGLYHEHTRPDRDDYITINFENINIGRDTNFHRNPNYQQEIVDAVDYDLGSVMHYKNRFFSSNGQNTIDINSDIYVPECVTMGQRKELTHKDAMKINTLYQCKEHLEKMKDRDDCIVVLPDPSPTVSVSLSPTPSPSVTPTSPPPPCNKYFKSGDEVFLKLGHNVNEVIQCSPDQRLGCSKSQCTVESGCRDTRYKIYLAENRVNTILRSGDEVVLEIVDSRSSRYAMACNRNESCLLETCPSNPPTNAPITSPENEFCESQKLKIYGYNDKGNEVRRILNYHDIVFRAVDNNEKFLNCYDRMCKFYSHETCDGEDDPSSGQSSTTCVPQQFELYHACNL